MTRPSPTHAFLVPLQFMMVRNKPDHTRNVEPNAEQSATANWLQLVGFSAIPVHRSNPAQELPFRSVPSAPANTVDRQGTVRDIK